MKTREDFMAQIEFEGRKTKRGCSAMDITITMAKRKNSINIYFRNDTKSKFPDGVIFGIYKNRIIFENSLKGFTISTGSTSKNDYGFCASTVSDSEKYRDWVGDYPLLWDDFYEFWYIEKEA